MEEYIQEMLGNFLQASNIPYTHISTEIKTEDSKEVYYINIDCDQAGKIIGKSGENIGHINHLLKLMLKKKFKDIPNIKLDIDNYFQRLKEKSVGIAEKYIEKLKQSNKEQSLPPMNPMLRATVHTHIAENHPNIKTESKGFGKYRYITINNK